MACTAFRINEINRLTWEAVRWAIDGKGDAAICLWTRKKNEAVRTPRWVPVIERVKQSLQYAYQHRTKNSPWVFTNPKMVVKYSNNPNRCATSTGISFLQLFARKREYLGWAIAIGAIGLPVI